MAAKKDTRGKHGARAKATPGRRVGAHAELRKLASAQARVGDAAAATDATTPPAGATAARLIPPRPAAPASERRAPRGPAGFVERGLRFGRAMLRTEGRRRFVSELGQQLPIVGDLQQAWAWQRQRTTRSALHAAREQASQFKTDVLAAGRFVLRHDAAAQRELDRVVAEGASGGLVGELRLLANFVARHRGPLAQSDLPARADVRAREFAALLSLAALEESRGVLGVHADRIPAPLRAVGAWIDRVRAALIAAPARIALLREQMAVVRRERGAASKRAPERRSRVRKSAPTAG